MFGSDRRGTTEAEEERGLDLPIHVFPLFENALRAGPGAPSTTTGATSARCGPGSPRWPPTNPYAWLRDARTADEIITATEANRMIAYPYTKLLTANMQVDQGAAIIMCSAAAAESAGIPRDRWVFPLAGADADDHWFLSHRLDFHSSPAIRLAGGRRPGAGRGDHRRRWPTSTSTPASPRRWRSPPPSSGCPTTTRPGP